MDMSKERFFVCPICGYYMDKVPDGTSLKIKCPRCGRKLRLTKKDKRISIEYREPLFKGSARLRRA